MLSSVLCSFSHFLKFGCHTPGWCHPGRSAPLPMTPLALSRMILAAASDCLTTASYWDKSPRTPIAYLHHLCSSAFTTGCEWMDYWAYSAYTVSVKKCPSPKTFCSIFTYAKYIPWNFKNLLPVYILTYAVYRFLWIYLNIQKNGVNWSTCTYHFTCSSFEFHQVRLPQLHHRRMVSRP